MARDRNDEEQRNLKALKLLRERADALEVNQDGMASDLEALKTRAKAMQRGDAEEGFDERKQARLARMTGNTPVADPNVDELYRDAETAFPGHVSVSDLLTRAEQRMTDARIGRYIDDFNARFGLVSRRTLSAATRG